MSYVFSSLLLYLIQPIEKHAIEKRRNKGYIASIQIPVLSIPPTMVVIAHRKHMPPKIK
tara:strand:+ start:1176 stop:1352 length:177 start_codon:yes stop_codon:yes gene_type:complete